jgi:PAS domain S-box-containing protein
MMHSAAPPAQSGATDRSGDDDFRAIFAAASIGMAQADPATRRFLRVNAAFCAITGYDEAELLALTIDDVTHPDDRGLDRDHFSRVVSGESPWCRFEKRYQRRDGGITWVEATATLVRADDGRPLRTVAMIQDVSARKRVEQALRGSEERLRLAVEANRIVAWEWDPVADRVTTSENFSEVYGLPALSGVDAGMALVWPEDLPPHREKVTRVAREGGEYHSRFRITRPRDGQTVWLEEHATGLTDGTGRVVRVVGVVTDVTDRVRTEVALRERERFVSGVANASPGLIYVYDLVTQRNLFVNDQFERLFGWTRDDLDALGEGFLFRLIHPDDLTAVTAEAARLPGLADREVVEVEYRLRRKDGAYRWVRSRDTVFARDAAGQVTQVLGMAEDVTERKEAEEALRESEYRLRIASEAAHIGIHDYDVVHNRIVWDDVLRAIWGVGADEPITYETFAAGIHPDDLTGTEVAVARALDPSGDGTYAAEYRVIDRGTGGVRWVAATGQVFFADGKPVRLTGTAQDVTERKEAEEALRRSEAIYRRLAEANLFGVGFGTSTGDVTFVNDEMLRMMGRTREEFEAGRINWAEAIAPEFREAIAVEAQRVLNEGSARGYEAVFVRPDGGRTPYVAAAALVERGEDHHVSLALDLTTIRAAEAALRESEARFRTMADETPVIIWATDAAGGIEFVNRAYCDFFGVTEEQVRGPNWQPLVHPDDAEVYVGAFLAALRAGKPFHAEARVRHAGGAWRWVESFGAPRLAATGEMLGMVGSSPDITERKESEAERIAFLDALAHDVKNPLGVARGQTQLLHRRLRRGTDDRTKLEESLEAIEAAVVGATALIDELLDVAHIRAGRPLDLRWDAVDLVALAETCAAEARAGHPGRTVRVAMDVATLEGQWDEARLKRVLRNLLDNAIKYSPGGGEVVVRVAREEAVAGAWAVVAVQDRGVGIPAGDLSRIFGRFQRGGNVADIGGTGIGLAGARQIVEQHGGTIAVESAEGEGSTFTVRLPETMPRSARA